MDEQTSSQPSYYAVIPANVRYAKIPPNAKLLYGEITALCNKAGHCWATNQHFADLYGVDDKTISLWVSTLVKNGFVVVEFVDRTTRKIRLPSSGKPDYPSQEKLTHNNKVNTSTIVDGLDKPTKPKTNLIKSDVFGKRYGNEDVNTILDAISKLTPTGKLDGSEYENRQRAHNLIQKYGKEAVLKTIKSIPDIPFWKGKVTSAGLLLKHFNAIISSKPVVRQVFTKMT